MMIVSMGKNVSLPAGMVQEQVKTAKLLLQFGARPDARDVCGKTVCHYGIGAMATDMTLQVASMCIEAHQSSHFYGKLVEPVGLNKEAMNGLQGYCKGYVVDTSRRIIYLIERNEMVGIKPENLKLVGVDETTTATTLPIKLCDIPDQIGGVCLHEVLTSDRTDVANVLLKKHEANLDIKDCDGTSPRSMAITGGPFSTVAALVNKAAAGQSRHERTHKQRICSNCGKLEKEKQLLTCKRYQSVQYCGKDCQVAHWSIHKKVCKEIATSKEVKGVVIPKPTGTGFSSMLNLRSGMSDAPNVTGDGDGY